MATLGDYRLLKILGKGAFSWVFLGEHIETGNRYALKVMERNKVIDGINLSDLAEKEIEITREINHPNIININDWSMTEAIVLDSGKQKEVCYMALDIASGGELFDIVFQTGILNERMARFYFLQLLDVLEYLHGMGISHCDIKLNNVLLDQDFNLKLSDFGLSSK